MKERSRARGWALQALYAWEARGEGPDTLLIAFEELAGQLRISERNRLYAEILLRLLAANLPRVDRAIQQHLTNWSLPRLSVVDRNILRLGVTELLYVDDVPPRVTMREAMHLAERYATPESPRFVNGVLDAVARSLDARSPRGGDAGSPPP